MTIQSHYDVEPGLAELIVSHPRIFRGQAPRVDSYVSAGWRQIVAELFAGIERLLPDELAARVTVHQIKEKLGGLRVYLGRDYCHAEDDDDAVNQLPPFPDEVWQQVGELVEAAEARAWETCEVCGAAGQLRNKGWLTVYCAQHAMAKGS